MKKKYQTGLVITYFEDEQIVAREMEGEFSTYGYKK